MLVRFISTTLLLSLIGFFFSCSMDESKTYREQSSLLEQIKKRGEINVAVSYHLPGLSLLNLSTNTVEGFEPDLARAIAKNLFGNENAVNFTLSLPQQHIALIQNQKVDLVIANMSITPDRANFVNFSEPYFITGQSLLVKKGSSITNVHDLGGKTVGAVQGTSSEEHLKKIAPEAIIVYINDFPGAFFALKNNLIDALTSDLIILEVLKSQTSEPDLFEIVGGTFTVEKYAIAMIKNQPELLQYIDKTLEAIISSGEWQQLYDKNLEPIIGPGHSPT